jgi:hypothetical protein
MSCRAVLLAALLAGAVYSAAQAQPSVEGLGPAPYPLDAAIRDDEIARPGREGARAAKQRQIELTRLLAARVRLYAARARLAAEGTRWAAKEAERRTPAAPD